jgi:hypothetical protein
MVPLRLATDAAGLELSAEHAKIAAPRRGTIRWELPRTAFTEAQLAAAAAAWRARAAQEYHSLALFTQLSGQLHQLVAPLDWAGAFARMIADEVRHTDIALRMTALCGGTPAEVEPGALHLPVTAKTLRAHVRGTVLAAFCIGETLSGRMFRRCLRAATVPVAKDAVRAIVVDETFHGRLGWELGALLMRHDGTTASRRERDVLARQLPEIFAHYRDMCGAAPGEAWAQAGAEADGAPNFGTLTDRGYARAFWEGMRDDVVPGLVAIGLPEAAAAFAEIGGETEKLTRPSSRGGGGSYRAGRR